MYTSFKVRFEQRSRSDNEAAASKAEKFYSTGMDAHFDPGKPCFDNIEAKHKISQEAAFNIFVNEPKMGGERADFREKVSYTIF
jgi:hypothetical protein